MKIKVYCVYDSKGENYGQPFMFDSRANALRGFAEACNDPQTNFFKYPSDFTLFEIGEWDKSTGSFELYESKVSLGLAVEYKNENNSTKRQNVDLINESTN